MNKSKIIILFLFAVLTVVGCKKEESGEKRVVEFTANLEEPSGNDAKLHLEEYTENDVNYMRPCWDESDVIQINDGNGSLTAINIDDNPTRARFSAVISGSSYCAVFPDGLVSGTVTSTPTIALPRVQVYETDATTGKQKINAPMAAYNSSRPVLEFKNLCGLLEITISNNKAWDMILDSIQVESSGANVCGEAQFSIDNNNPTFSQWVSGGKKVVSLVGAGKTSMNDRLNSNQNRTDVYAGITPNGKTEGIYYISLPPIASGAGNTFTIRVFSHPIFNAATDVTSPTEFASSDQEDDKVHIVYERTSNANAGYMERNEIVPLTLNLSEATKLVFTSMKDFTVDANETKVCFSRGYVQWHISDNKWRFAPRQWSFMNPQQGGIRTSDTYVYHGSTAVGTPTNQLTYHNATWVEFFGWGTGDNPKRIGVPSYMINNANVNSGDELGSTTDWGRNFTTASWYTPSRDMYQYVFKGRESTVMNDPIYTLPNGHTWKFGWATVTGGNWGEGNTSNGYQGNIAVVILIPDHFNPMRLDKEKGGRRLGISAFVSSESAMTGTITETEGGENSDSQAEDSDDATNIKRRDDNTYTKAQLEYLEAHGCIIFPCIGHMRKVGVGEAAVFYYNNDAAQWDEHLNPPDVRIWSRTKRNETTAFQALFDAGNPAGSQPNTRNVLKAHDDACDLHSVRLVCPSTTSYKWDPDQM